MLKPNIINYFYCFVALHERTDIHVDFSIINTHVFTFSPMTNCWFLPDGRTLRNDRHPRRQTDTSQSQTSTLYNPVLK